MAARPRPLPSIPPPLSVAIDLEPLVDQVVARLRPLLTNSETRPAKRAFRTPEVAQLLSISDSEVRELVSRGELDSITIGRIRLVPLSAIDEFLQRKLAAARTIQ